MYRTVLSHICLDRAGLASLEARWRGFASQAAVSFFQDWTWVGCAAWERYREPILLETFRGDRLAGLALFDRRVSMRDGETLILHESADAQHASPFIEHNGPLLLATDPVLRQAIMAQMLAYAIRGPIGSEPARRRRVVLSGVDPDCAVAAGLAGGTVSPTATRVAPFVDFRALSPRDEFLHRASRNTRHQIRRSNRLYAGAGSLTLRRAETVETALEYLADLIRYHKATWQARGKPGAFATETARAFYRALIETGVPRDEVDMLQITAGEAVVGYLMNFRHGGNVSAYQSGFNYQDSQHLKPGMTCHYLAIEHYRAQGAKIYDFLAGADRYKLSLANARRSLHWLAVTPPWYPHAIGPRLRRWLQPA